MKNKRNRLQLIVELVKKNNVGSQNELAELLKKVGVKVTQATLSRDLKTLRITKVATDRGGYTYIIPNSNALKDSLLLSGRASLRSGQEMGVVSLEFSGNIAVIKTRNGYAPGLAYDIDMSRSQQILGTIAGSDTVLAVLREGVTHDQARAFFSRFLPMDGGENLANVEAGTQAENQ